MKITSSTPLYAVLGHPVGQSLSPILQNGWIQEHGYNGVYVALDVVPNQFSTALAGLYQSGLQGANVTTPFKEQAARLAVSLSQRAQVTQSVNCLTAGPAGFAGDSTDGAGFIADLDTRAPAWRDGEGHVVLIGAGGAARAILYALAQAGITNITLVNRDFVRAQNATAMLGPKTVEVKPWSDLADSIVGANLVINATSAGFKGENPLEVDVSQTSTSCLVYDSVYAPRQTAFLLRAQSQQRQTLDGLGMLVGQGALAFKGWFGAMPDVKSGIARLEAELAS